MTGNFRLSTFLSMSDRKFKNIMTVVITLVTAFTSLVGYLEGSASAHRAQANRDTNMYAQQVMGSQLAGYTQINYAQRVAYDTWLELDTLAASAQLQGDVTSAARYRQLRDEATHLSPMLSPKILQP